MRLSSKKIGDCECHKQRIRMFGLDLSEKRDTMYEVFCVSGISRIDKWKKSFYREKQSRTSD